MKINITKENLKDVGTAGLKVGKAIIIEGTKAVAWNGAMNVMKASFKDGDDGVKGLTVDKFLGKGKKSKKTKIVKSIFKRKKKEDIDVPDVTVSNVADDTIIEVVEEVTVEVVEKEA